MNQSSNPEREGAFNAAESLRHRLSIVGSAVMSVEIAAQNMGINIHELDAEPVAVEQEKPDVQAVA